MVYIPIAEVVKKLGKSDRQVRRMVHSGKLAYRYAPDKKLEILSSDVDKWVRHALPAQELERLDTLERRVAELEARLDKLTIHPITTTLKPRRIPYQAEAPAPGESLPPGYTPIHDLIKEHGLTRQRQAIMRHMRPWMKQGHWKREGHEVKNCLDQEGVKEFQRRYVDQSP